METKICRICKKEKPLREISRHKKSKDGYDTICKECNKKLVYEWKEKNHNKFMDYQIKYNKGRIEQKREDGRKRRRVIKDFIHNYKKDKQCLICGFNKNTDILVFHHRNPENKEFKISQRNTSTIDVLTEEIKKCDLLCPNCHRELHWNEMQNNLKENVSETTIKKRKYQEWFNELKKDGCSKCGEKRFYVLDYHHIENNKEHEIHKMVQTRAAKKKMIEEIDKCILLCANCHSELHL